MREGRERRRAEQLTRSPARALTHAHDTHRPESKIASSTTLIAAWGSAAGGQRLQAPFKPLLWRLLSLGEEAGSSGRPPALHPPPLRPPPSPPPPRPRCSFATVSAATRPSLFDTRVSAPCCTVVATSVVPFDPFCTTVSAAAHSSLFTPWVTAPCCAVAATSVVPSYPSSFRVVAAVRPSLCVPGVTAPSCAVAASSVGSTVREILNLELELELILSQMAQDGPYGGEKISIHSMRLPPFHPPPQCPSPQLRTRTGN